MNIRESSEMYLETILILSKNGPVRAIDIVKELNFAGAGRNCDHWW